MIHYKNTIKAVSNSIRNKHACEKYKLHQRSVKNCNKNKDQSIYPKIKHKNLNLGINCIKLTNKASNYKLKCNVDLREKELREGLERVGKSLRVI